MLSEDHVKQVNLEQARQINIYKWIESERAGKDVSDTATVEWIKKYAVSFRKWAESIPYECLKCGLCKSCDGREECCRPFDEERLKRINH
jgi:hypothetical protein